MVVGPLSRISFTTTATAAAATTTTTTKVAFLLVRASTAFRVPSSFRIEYRGSRVRVCVWACVCVCVCVCVFTLAVRGSLTGAVGQGDAGAGEVPLAVVSVQAVLAAVSVRVAVSRVEAADAAADADAAAAAAAAAAAVARLVQREALHAQVELVAARGVRRCTPIGRSVDEGGGGGGGAEVGGRGRFGLALAQHFMTPPPPTDPLLGSPSGWGHDPPVRGQVVGSRPRDWEPRRRTKG